MLRALRSVAMALLDVRPALMQRRCAGAALEPGGRLHPIDLGLLWIAKLDTAALAAASAWRLRSPIRCRSCSAAAASTVLLTIEKIRALLDT